jgi:hypothetical protein
MHGLRSKIPSKISHPYIYIYDVKFLALLGTPYIYDISRLRVNHVTCYIRCIKIKMQEGSYYFSSVCHDSQW